ncbi:MAG TPA: ABC transporter permease, partial [Actinotalea sp.]|nr:ABC transporter permease [Actinotalea sp.]
GTAAFVAIGLVLAGTLRAEAVLAGANLLWGLLAVGGGIVVPADRPPTALPVLVAYLPSGALGDGLRAALAGEGFAVGPAIVLGAWAAAGGAAAARTFRWSS